MKGFPMWLDRIMRKRVETLGKLETEGMHKRAEVEDAEREVMKKIETEETRIPIASAIIWKGRH